MWAAGADARRPPVERGARAAGRPRYRPAATGNQRGNLAPDRCQMSGTDLDGRPVGPNSPVTWASSEGGYSFKETQKVPLYSIGRNFSW